MAHWIGTLEYQAMGCGLNSYSGHFYSHKLSLLTLWVSGYIFPTTTEAFWADFESETAKAGPAGSPKYLLFYLA